MPSMAPISTRSRPCSTPSTPPATRCNAAAKHRSGCASAPTRRGFSKPALQPVEHIRADQRDAAVAAVEALGVECRILADDEVFRDMAATIDNHLGEPCIAPDMHLRQQHRLAGPGVGIDPHARKLK